MSRAQPSRPRIRVGMIRIVFAWPAQPGGHNDGRHGLARLRHRPHLARLRRGLSRPRRAAWPSVAAFTRRQRDTADFFLARRHIPWWAACLSFLATEISAVTIISVPATAYAENWQYVQFFVGSSLAKLVVAFLFIPAFYRYDCTTIYEFLRHRFGAASQVTGSLFFFVTRLLGSGVRLMVAALAVSILMGWPFGATLALFTGVSILYIALGGVSAVVWTNVLQAEPLPRGRARDRRSSHRPDGGWRRRALRDGGGGGTPVRRQLGARARRSRSSGGACSPIPTSSGWPCSTGWWARWRRSAPTTTSCSASSPWRRGARASGRWRSRRWGRW